MNRGTRGAPRGAFAGCRNRAWRPRSCRRCLQIPGSATTRPRIGSNSRGIESPAILLAPTMLGEADEVRWQFSACVMEHEQNASDSVAWAFPPVAGILAYRKLTWLGSSSVVRTERQMFLASSASLLLCIVFLGCAALEALVFRDVPIAGTSAWPFQNRQVFFATISVFFATVSLLLALHSAILYSTRRNDAHDRSYSREFEHRKSIEFAFGYTH